MPALITFDQVTQPAGVAGEAREDFVTGQLVSCTNDTVESSYAWVLVDTPIRSALVRGLTSTNATFAFTPDVKGTYLVTLQVNGSAFPTDSAESFCAVLTTGTRTLGWRYPAAGEQNQDDNTTQAGLGFPSDVNPRGWATPRDLQMEQTEIATEGVVNAVVTSPGVGPDNLVRIDSATGKLDPSVVPVSTGGLTPTAAKVANYTALFNERVLYDPSGGTFTITAPVTPLTGEQWAIKNVTTDTTSITINGNGNNIEDPLGPAFVASYAVNITLISVIYMFDGTNWIIL